MFEYFQLLLLLNSSHDQNQTWRQILRSSEKSEGRLQEEPSSASGDRSRRLIHGSSVLYVLYLIACEYLFFCSEFESLSVYLLD